MRAPRDELAPLAALALITAAVTVLCLVATGVGGGI